jgi:HAD superfamily hydrolase (TIGR01509 family)
MDGLMFDTERLYRESWMVLAEEFGQTPNPDFPAAVAGSAGDIMRGIIRRYYPDIDADGYMNACIKRVADIVAVSVPEKPGLRKLLKLLRNRGVKLAVASSSPEATIEGNLRTAGLRECFDAVVSSSHPAVKNSKPAPDVFLYAAQCIGIAPEDCYVFEDSLNGIRAGHAAGAAAIMVPDTMEPTEEIRQICSVYPDLGAVASEIEEGKL